ICRRRIGRHSKSRLELGQPPGVESQTAVMQVNRRNQNARLTRTGNHSLSDRCLIWSFWHSQEPALPGDSTLDFTAPSSRFTSPNGNVARLPLPGGLRHNRQGRKHPEAATFARKPPILVPYSTCGDRSRNHHSRPNANFFRGRRQSITLTCQQV